jgi:hypothetical protein
MQFALCTPSISPPTGRGRCLTKEVRGGKKRNKNNITNYDEISFEI